MYPFTAPFFTLFLFVLQHGATATSGRRIEERQEGDLSFCFGDNSICTFSNDLWSQCQNVLSEIAKWYSCVCGNGYVSVDEACIWCQEAYNLTFIDDVSENKRGCSSVGVSVAPIPTSILAVESHYNQTYTGGLTISGANPTVSGVSPTNQVSNSGVTNIVTLNGGSQAPTRTAPALIPAGLGGSPSTTTSSTAKIGSSTGGAGGQKSGVASVFSFVAFVLSSLSLI